MRTILHLSDLHFGRTDPVVVMAVLDFAHRFAPDLVVVSGDLTQRARVQEFVAAREFLDSLSAPKLVVPGNHDVPLYNVLARFLRPLRHYQTYITEDVQPVFADEEITVVGIRTARSLTWKGGRINRDQVHRARDVFCRAPQTHVRILVSHHPFDLPLQPLGNALVGRAAMAMAGWRECAPDVFLAGHLHLQGTGIIQVRPVESGAAILVQAGTATSTRIRGEKNSVNFILVRSDEIEVDRHDWHASSNRFEFKSKTAFGRTGGGWHVTHK